MLAQWKDLPIGGHLSAAYVELVALRRELQCEWPSALTGLPTARYRDNFFVVMPAGRAEEEHRATAMELSALLLMPVVFERAGRVARCLELRLSWAEEDRVKAHLAYRTDADRQGESGDVRTWPEWSDPRTPALLRGLLAGLASKLVRYSAAGVGGFPSSIRAAVQFLRRRGYPSRRRPFAAELVRHGAPAGCLPKNLRAALQSEKACDGPSQ